MSNPTPRIFAPVSREHFTKRGEELAGLPPGWLDGEGEGLDPERTREAVRRALDLFGPLDLLPNLFPTPEGGLSMEWHLPGIGCSIEVDLRNMSAEFMAVHFETGRATCKDLTPDNWGWMLGPLKVWSQGGPWKWDTK